MPAAYFYTITCIEVLLIDSMQKIKRKKISHHLRVADESRIFTSPNLFGMSSVKCELAMLPSPSLASMSTEILHMIVRYLSQPALHALMLTNSYFVEIAALRLYDEPFFASTYRFAQFVNAISHSSRYALMVRSLDLSNIPNDALDSTGQYLPSAGWREFKHRHSDMYYASQENITPSHKSTKLLRKQKPLTSHQTLRNFEGREAPESSHPPPSPLLESFHRKRDIPVGAFCHVLAACRRLRVNLSHVQLAIDFLVVPADMSQGSSRFVPGQFMTRFATSSSSTSSSTHSWTLPLCLPNTQRHPFSLIASPLPLPPIFKSTPATCETPLHTFVSDIDESWPWQSNELVPIYADEITFWLCTLKELEEVKLEGSVWVNGLRARRLVVDAVRAGDELKEEDAGYGKMLKGLQKMDLRECGIDKTARWTVEASREEVERLVYEAFAA
ncbi:hypothetical protein EG329_014350 [Mollisiaceae sp. DMI_Dod_QoI]|nr:hypothetical protein EG329_014350 [Helotiales sp. DMI_Dod_QoI]